MIAENILLTEKLKAGGYSLTHARTVVFEALSSAPESLTMAELVECSSAVDRASVYRTVDVFEKLSIVNRVYVGWKYKLELSDAFSHHHHHLSCIKCSTVVLVEESPVIEKAIIGLTRSAGFRPDSHQLEIRGTCSQCQSEGATRK